MAARALGYARISEDDARQGLGVGRQQADIEAYAKTARIKLVEVLVDNDVSASRYGRKPRLGYRRLLELIEAGVASTVIVWDLDRLLRQPKELEELIDIAEKAALEVRNLNGEIDLRTADGRFVARILVAKAAKESDDLSRRVKRQKLQRAEQGLPVGGGKRAFGYDQLGTTLIPEEAAAIRRAAEVVLAGGTLAAAIAAIEELGVLPVAGGRWEPSVVKRCITNPLVAGLRAHHGQIVGPGTWPPILDRATWEAVKIEMGRRRRDNRPYRSHLLTGIAVCGHDGCGNRLGAQVTSRNRQPGPVVYACRSERGGCGRLSIRAAGFEATVEAEIASWLNDPAIAAAIDEHLTGGDDDVDLARLDADRAQLEELAAMAGRSEITMAEWKAARAPVQERIAAAEAGLAQSASPRLGGVSAAELARAWEGLDRAGRRAVIAALCDRIVVAPVGRGHGRVFDPARVRLVPAWEL